MWDPGQYQHFGDERSRPFFDLLARVAAENPGQVADLGCGPGTLTATLADRRRLSFAIGDVRDWRPAGHVDVIVSNAVLQWVPDHLSVAARWAGFLQPGGWLAFQVPANYDQPSHAALRELAASDRWRALLGDVPLNRQASDPAEYLDLLARAGLEVDAWETTYLHVLHGEDPVLDWYKGTGLRPVLAALRPDQAAEFLDEYRARMNEAYPAEPYGTVFPFRRVFVVGVRR